MDDSGLAFPVAVNVTCITYETFLRDWLAGQAMIALGATWEEEENLAEQCYRIADAMLVKREPMDGE